MLQAKVAGLFVYPAKGMRGIALDSATVLPRGIAQDRRWMVVTPEGRFLTQREVPALARIATSFRNDSLLLDLDGELIELPVDDRGQSMRVVVWRDEVDAVRPDPAADRALSAFLGRVVVLVRFPDTTFRPCKPHIAPDASTGFADAFPMLVTTTASLDEVNATIIARGGQAVPMTRFRPNIVLEGVPARAEDAHRWLTLPDGGTIELVSECERCIVTTTDQESGERLGPEPIATLKRIRASAVTKAPTFGRNATLRGPATSLALGDQLTLGDIAG